MIDCLNGNFLSQLVNQPTFLSNFLDLDITNDPTRIHQVHNGPPLGSTRFNHFHSTLTWDFLLRSEKTNSSETKPRRNYMKGNYEAISVLLSKTFTRFCDFNVDESYGELVSTYSKAIDKFILTTRVKNTNIKPNPKWFNSKIKQATSQKYKLYFKLRASPENTELKYLYSSACKHVKLLVKAALFEYEDDLVKKCKSNPKLLYSYINGQKACKEYIRTLTNTDGSLTSDKSVIVGLLNEQFCRVLNPGITHSPSVSSNPVITHPCVTDSNMFSTENVSKAIYKLNVHKSAGSDGIQPQVIKRCSHIFAQILGEIFRCSFYSDTVPESWKEANITPIFKKGNR